MVLLEPSVCAQEHCLGPTGPPGGFPPPEPGGCLLPLSIHMGSRAAGNGQGGEPHPAHTPPLDRPPLSLNFTFQASSLECPTRSLLFKLSPQMP